MDIKYFDEYVNKEKKYSLGYMLKDGEKINYVSIPVANDFINYEEYYSIDDQEYFSFIHNAHLADSFAEKCKNRLCDERLILGENDNRGTPI